eukprot:TRINITY_DN54480_c0_g1_i1.p2 TRINITY_DN54480_c0_g1~~TRINITY_DN54480_c0_g1_i1.p2  ORF type:complete len:124 (-),score=46.26 TRINITY_DN54480_c0_g1_i1:143-514(-)
MGDSDDEEQEKPEDAEARALANLPKVNVRKNELREDLFQKLQMMCVNALKKHKLQKDAAAQIKAELDMDPNFNELIGKGPWQVVVGRSFGCAVVYEAMHVAMFDIPSLQETIMVYRALGVQSL